MQAMVAAPARELPDWDIMATKESSEGVIADACLWAKARVRAGCAYTEAGACLWRIAQVGLTAALAAGCAHAPM